MKTSLIIFGLAALSHYGFAQKVKHASYTLKEEDYEVVDNIRASDTTKTSTACKTTTKAIPPPPAPKTVVAKSRERKPVKINPSVAMYWGMTIVQFVNVLK